jgi:hypothetical protein
MFKKIAFVLIIVMVFNLSACSLMLPLTVASVQSNSNKDGGGSGSAGTAFVIGAGIDAAILTGIIAWGTYSLIMGIHRAGKPRNAAEAGAPDDEIKLVSNEVLGAASPIESNRLFYVLRHVQAGATQDGGMFVGARFNY